MKGRVQIDAEPSLARKPEIRAYLVITVIGWKCCCVDLELQNARGGRKLIVENCETLKGCTSLISLDCSYSQKLKSRIKLLRNRNQVDLEYSTEAQENEARSELLTRKYKGS